VLVFSESAVVKKRHLWAVNCVINIKKRGLDSGGEDMAGFLKEASIQELPSWLFFCLLCSGTGGQV
jgi:hypothetical protein